MYNLFTFWSDCFTVCKGVIKTEYMEKMKEYREALNLSQKELAGKVGVSEASISNYETGKREPDFKTLCALADLFDCSLDMLIRGKEKDRHEGRSMEELLKMFRNLSDEQLNYFIALMQVTKADRQFQAHLRQGEKADQ